jgi:hypothetical protein
MTKRVPRRLCVGYNIRMSKAEILAELPKLKPDELAEVQAKLDELAGEVWQDGGELSDDDKTALDAALVDYQKNPDAGSPWNEVKGRIQGKLRP